MEFDRRTVIKGIASLPIAARLADPMPARAAAITIDSVTIKSAGGQTVRATLALPARLPAPAVFLIHDWWGVNDQIMSVATDFAKEGYLALAVDLYHGKVAADQEEARDNVRRTKPREAIDTLKSWIKWLKKSDKLNGRIAVIGWGVGGGWALSSSIVAPVDATVIYYGRVNKSANQLERLEGPVLGHFATRDRVVDKKMVNAFEREMGKAGKADSLTVHWYDADHAFADPTDSRYTASDAKLAWKRTMGFLLDYM